MKGSKVIRGKPEYYYKGRRYLDLPEKTVIKKIIYDEDENRSYVYCRKPSKGLEYVCAVVIIVCILLNQLYLHSASFSVKYTSICYYYNGSLYVNMYNSDDSVSDITIGIHGENGEIYSGVLSPGSCLVSIPVDEIEDSYTVEMRFRSLFTVRTETVRITVIDRGGSYGE